MVKRLLLAEDDPDDQEFFQDFLKDREDLLILPVVINGEEVLDYLSGNKTYLPDLIILDQNMPRMNGLETLLYLKSKKEYAHIPVMIYSTYPDDILIARSLHYGAHLVSTKPQDRDGYYAMIDAFLSAAKTIVKTV